jgi:hypothetical protein
LASDSDTARPRTRYSQAHRRLRLSVLYHN